MTSREEFIETTKGKVCEFEFDGNKCDCQEVKGIARGRFLCHKHFKTIQWDNIRRINKGIDIPDTLKFLKTPPIGKL